MAESDKPISDDKAREQNQKEHDDATKARQDRDFETNLATADVPITALDGLGVERIVLNSPAGYTPPQVDPDPKEVERLKNLQTRLDNKKSERLEQLTASPDAGGKVAAEALKAESSSSSNTAPATTGPSTTGASTSTNRPS